MSTFANSFIKKAALADVDRIFATYSELLNYESQHGVNTNWKKGVYPVREVPLTKTKAGSMYVLEKEGAIYASMALDSMQSPEYAAINWRYPAPPEKVLTIHALVVQPQNFGQGYGSQMLRFAKDFGSKNGFFVIRIDTWINNEPAKALYLKHGFEIAGYGPITLYGLTQHEVYLEYKI